MNALHANKLYSKVFELMAAWLKIGKARPCVERLMLPHIKTQSILIVAPQKCRRQQLWTKIDLWLFLFATQILNKYKKHITASRQCYKLSCNRDVNTCFSKLHNIYMKFFYYFCQNLKLNIAFKEKPSNLSSPRLGRVSYHWKHPLYGDVTKSFASSKFIFHRTRRFPLKDLRAFPCTQKLSSKPKHLYRKHSTISFILPGNFFVLPLLVLLVAGWLAPL